MFIGKQLTVLFLASAVLFSIAVAQVNLSGIQSWAYQLQNMNISQIAADTTFQLIVIDYSADGSDAMKFSSAQIDSIKSSGKTVVSYISIGEAEDYRSYWNPAWYVTPPVWLGPENPDWPGNFKVRYWDAQWQQIIFQWIDTIIAQGFDGIYLDIIDAWYYWQVENPEQPLSDSLMCQFIINIRNHTDSVTGSNNFLMIPQNGEDVINQSNVSAALKTGYLNAINGVGIEDVFFYGPLDENNIYNPDNYRIGVLDEYIQNQKRVFSIEYLTDSTKIQQYISAASAHDYVPYACTRNLDQLCNGINVYVTNIQKSEMWSLKIQPELSNGIITFYNTEHKITNLKLFNITGEILLEAGINSRDAKIDLSSFPKGFYLLKIYCNSQWVTKKLVLE